MDISHEGTTNKDSTGSNITLIGMPGVGKSTIGVIAAKVLGYRFLDTDLLIQETYGMLLSEIIAQRGVDGFLEAENKVLSGITANKCIIATGGSAVYGTEAMQNLKSQGTIIWLKLDYEHLSSRLGDLKGRGVVLREGQDLRALYDERTALYERYADITINEQGLGIEETVEQLVKRVDKVRNPVL